MDLRTKLRFLVNELPERDLETAASYLEFLKAHHRDQEAAQALLQDEETEIELTAEPKKAKWPFVLHNLGPRRWEKNWGNGSEEVEATVFRTEVNGRQLTLTVGQVVDGRWAYGEGRVRFHVEPCSHNAALGKRVCAAGIACRARVGLIPLVVSQRRASAGRPPT